MTAAIISGRLAKAFVPGANGEWQVIHYGEPEARQKRHSEPWVFSELRDCEDAQSVTGDTEAVRDALDFAVDLTESVDLTLWLLDGTLNDVTRHSAAQELDELLAYPEIQAAWADLFWAKPLTPDADLLPAIRIASGAEAGHVSASLGELSASQDAITRVRVAWNSLRSLPTIDEATWRRLEGWGLRAGLFRSWVGACRRGPLAVVKEQVTWFAKTEPRQLCREWAAVCKAWATALSGQATTKMIHDISQLEHEEDEKEDRKVKRDLPRQGIDRKATLEKVQSQKARALRALDEGDLDRARKIANELVEYQLKSGGAEFAVKSLCDLAQRAYELDCVELQHEWAERGFRLVPDDSWACCQYGHALRQTGDYDRALRAYDDAISFEGHSAVAKNGRAEVLKALERYDDALAAYDTVRREHPHDVYAKTGRAEVLKALGRYVEALDAYDVIRRDHPDDVYAKTGRADVLKVLGRYDEALAVYERAGREHPTNAVAQTGRADVLKVLGRYDEALAAYEQAGRKHPNDAVAKNGRAEVLKALGRYDEALTAYDVIRRDHPYDVYAKTGRADVLKAMGRYDEALDAYDTTRRDHPTNAVGKTGRWSTLMAAGRANQVWEEIPETQARTQTEWIAQHIRAMAAIRLGKLGEARRLLQNGLDDCPSPSSREYFRMALAVLQLRQRNYASVKGTLQDVQSASLAVPRALLLAHAAGEQGETQTTRELLDGVSGPITPLGRSVATELRVRYVDHLAPVHDDEWLFSRELELLGTAA